LGGLIEKYTTGLDQFARDNRNTWQVGNCQNFKGGNTNGKWVLGTKSPFKKIKKNVKYENNHGYYNSFIEETKTAG